MIKKLFIALIISTSCIACAQVVQNPIADGAETGRTYFKWVIDINHDGIDDVLVSLKETPDEIRERKAEEGALFNSNTHTFAVYLGLAGNGAYTKDSGVNVNTSECYVGNIQESGQYGIVTIEEVEVSGPAGKGLPIPKKQVYCYTVKEGHAIRTNLTPLYDVNEENPVYEKYLSKSKRTQVTLQEVTP